LGAFFTIERLAPFFFVGIEALLHDRQPINPLKITIERRALAVRLTAGLDIRALDAECLEGAAFEGAGVEDLGSDTVFLLAAVIIACYTKFTERSMCDHLKY